MRNHKQTRARFPGLQARAEMSEHGPAIMRYHNPVYLGRSFQEFRIADAFQVGFGSRGEVNAGLSLADRFNNGVLRLASA